MTILCYGKCSCCIYSTIIGNSLTTRLWIMGFPAGDRTGRWTYVRHENAVSCCCTETQGLSEGGLMPQTERGPSNFSNFLPPEVKQKRWQSCLIWLFHLCSAIRVNLPWSSHLFTWTLHQTVLRRACVYNKCVYVLMPLKMEQSCCVLYS